MATRFSWFSSESKRNSEKLIETYRALTQCTEKHIEILRKATPGQNTQSLFKNQNPECAEVIRAYLNSSPSSGKN